MEELCPTDRWAEYVHTRDKDGQLLPCCLCGRRVIWRWREAVPPQLSGACRPEPHIPACQCGATTDLWLTIWDAHSGGWVFSLDCREHVYKKLLHDPYAHVSPWDEVAKATPMNDTDS